MTSNKFCNKNVLGGQQQQQRLKRSHYNTKPSLVMFSTTATNKQGLKQRITREFPEGSVQRCKPKSRDCRRFPSNFASNFLFKTRLCPIFRSKYGQDRLFVHTPYRHQLMEKRLWSFPGLASSNEGTGARMTRMYYAGDGIAALRQGFEVGGWLGF